MMHYNDMNFCLIFRQNSKNYLVHDILAQGEAGNVVVGKIMTTGQRSK
jgi:hypothetical protein